MPEIKFRGLDPDKLYTSMTFSDGEAGSIEARWPCLATGEPDGSRKPQFYGTTNVQIQTARGPARMELVFEIKASNLDEAMTQFPIDAEEAYKTGMEHQRSQEIRQTLIQSTRPGKA